MADTDFGYPLPSESREVPVQHGESGAPSQHDPSAMLTVVGGDAYAAGASTDATGVVSNHITDLGNVTIASGYAIFEATATSPAHGSSMAAADTFLSVTGADIVMEFDFNTSFHIGNTMVAASEISYIAIDIANWTPPHGPLVMDFSAHSAIEGHGHGNAYLPSLVPSGNFAQVAAVADAQGPNTLTSTLTQALTIENHFSLVSGAAMVAA